jgi:hypothetical protein
VTRVPIARRVVAELLGTALLVAAVVGSGIMRERLAGGNVALALLANTVATGAALVAFVRRPYRTYQCPATETLIGLASKPANAVGK